jgi:hypothetical protein
MRKSFFALLGLIPQAALAGCYCFVEPLATSDCTRTQSELVWLNPVRLLERVSLPRLPYDRQIYDPALSQGLAVKGDLQFDLRAPGPQVVEIFLVTPPDDTHSFVLEAGGKPIDSRHEAVVSPAPPSPRDGMRMLTLMGVLNGSFAVRSTATRYVISAIRWTPQKRFEEEVAPAWLDRTRQLSADPFFEDLRAQRRDSLQQLYDRLALGSRAEIRREAVVGRARMAYWLAAENQEPRDIARADSLFREAFNLAPDDRILRQVISSSCSGRNVESGRMPYGGYCLQAEPVPWSVVVPPDAAGAPEWAVRQRRLAARLEAITRWWVERRQQSDGQIGGGWRSDAQILRQWGPQALGLGASVAATGIRRLADGIWASGLPANEDGSGVMDEGRSWEPLADAQSWMAALAPEDANVIARLRQAAEHAKGPALWYAYFTGDGAGDPGRPEAAGQRSGSAADVSAFDVTWAMTTQAGESESILARDFDMYTSEVIYPDRVYYPLSLDYTRYLFGGDAPRGDRYPAFAVTWPPAETAFARAVVAATSTALRLRLYSFETKPSTVQVRVWRLKPGKYRWVSRDTIGTELDRGDLAISKRAQTVSLRLPPARDLELTLSRVSP